MKRLGLCVMLIALVLACAHTGFSSTDKAAQQPAAPQAHTAPAEDSAQTRVLFSGMDQSSITAISVTAADRHFEFLCSGPDDVSVNGQLADSEAFDTLVFQIANLPVTPREAFSPAGEPLLTVVVTTPTASHTASFYRSSVEDTACVLTGPAESPCYEETDAWRVGTLLLTCDGTRIQDERGNETPAE